MGGTSCTRCEDNYWGVVHPSCRISFMRGVYLLIFCCILSAAKRSLVYVNSMNCIFMLGSGWRGGVPLYGMPWTQSMFGLSRTLQWHLVCLHEQGSSHCGTVLSGEEFMNLPAFIRV